MNCGEAQSWLHAYLDGELQAPATLQYEQHIRECSACARTLAEQKELQTAMRSDLLYYKAPEGLRERLTSAVRSQRSDVGVDKEIENRPGHNPLSGFRPRTSYLWRWAAVAACLLLCVGIGFLLAQMFIAPSKHERLVQEVVASHVRSMQVEKARLVDIRESDGHKVKPWFNDKLDFSPPVPDLAQQGFALVGGRLDYLDGRAVAALVYKRRQHLINVFLWPDSANTDTSTPVETRQGFHVVHWSRAGMNFWVVSDLNVAELGEFAQHLK
jgi:anti-sigma factor RsiW